MFRQEEQPKTGVRQFGTHTTGKVDHMLGTHATVRPEYKDPPPKRTVPTSQLEAVRNIETQYIKARKAAEDARERQGTSHLYAAGKGWGH
nr:Chain p, FAP70 [Chlamydomonas reinhardtii]7SOM_q Chain q, FAP70 [Chlamydomonas reinhardtii]7SOM_r Chain r, FAP70 [Chlamydomonas reinhardtii]|eukprot:XP_001698475.1 predicted protein [Chlamydomonas reinhardtii]